MDATFIELAATLTALAVKGTASAVANKVKAIQSNKDVEMVRSSYNEIINELQSERDEAIRIAQAYKSEVDRIQISDEDIDHLHATVDQFLSILPTFAQGTDVSKLEPLKSLITKDTLKAMQLLGFNYHEAIGQPLTKACASAITNWANKNTPIKKR